MKRLKRQPFIHSCAIMVFLALSLSACGPRPAAPVAPPPEAPAAPAAPSQGAAEPTTAPAAPEPAESAAAQAPEPAASVTSPNASTSMLTEEWQPLPPECDWGKVVVARNATITRAEPKLQPGPLFTTSGSFAEKPVDEPCDPGQELGPFPVSDGGTLVARLTGSPAAPNQWSLRNYGTSLLIVYEPLLGEDNYGTGQEILSFAIPAEQTEAEMGGSWPGPGRLRAYIGAPYGAGPLTSSCFEQSYAAEAEIVEVAASGPLMTGMTLRHGDRIVTEDGWGEVVIAGSNDRIGPGSEIWFTHFGQQVQVREGTADLVGGRRPDSWNDTDHKLALKLEEFRKAGYLLPENTNLADYGTTTLDTAYAHISDVQDPCLAALELKLYLDSLPQGFPKKALDLVTDVAGIWLSASKWDALDSWGKWAFGKVPVLGSVAQAQNVLDTWERVKKEWTPTVVEQKASWTLAAYETYKAQDWSEAQIEEEQRKRLQESEEKRAEIERLRQNFEAMVPPLNAATEAELAEIRADANAKLAKLATEAQAAWEALQKELAALPEEDPAAPKIEGRRSLKQQREEEFWEEAGRKRVAVELSRDAAMTEVQVPFFLQMQGLANEYERQVTELLTDMARLQAESEALETYAKPLARRDCPGVKPDKALPPPDPCTGDKIVDLAVKKGVARIVDPWLGPGGKAIRQTISVNFGSRKVTVRPDGTDYSVEMKGETALVRVNDGQVVITSEDAPPITVAAGQQAVLPEGEISALLPEPEVRVGGIPLAELHLDSDVPEPYGVSLLRAENGSLPPDWSWQEPNADLNATGDTTLEVIDPATLRVTVPNENEFYGYRFDAPRLLHKVTGDFDLEAEMLLESKGTHFAISEFLLFTPDTPLGRLQGQMNTGGLGDHYFIAGGGWAHWQDGKWLSVLHRQWGDSAGAPDEPVRVRLSRRGDQIKAFWSKDAGATWTLASRHVMALPDTLWAGWLFKRMAQDGLYDEPAVTTLTDIRLTAGEPGSLPEADWDLADHEGMVSASGNELLMMQAGSAQSYVQALSPRAIAGDFDLIVRFDAPPAVVQPDQERHIHVGVTSNDAKNHAYLSNALTPDGHRYSADMAINEGWYRYHQEATQDSSGRIRLVRKDGKVTGYTWKEGDWAPLAEWQDDFSYPVFLDLRYQWKTPIPSLQWARFTIERLETEDGLLFGSDESARVTPGAVEATATPAAQAEATATPPAQAQATAAPAAPAAPVLTGAQRLEASALFDDFSSPALGWSVRDNDTATTGYQDGGYAILVKQPTYWVMSKVPGEFAQRVIEFDAAVASGSAGGMYGVICHYLDSENYDFVAVDPETGSVSAGRLQAGQFRFLSGDPNGATEVRAKGLADSITGLNHIRVGCYDDRLELAIGGKNEGSWPLDPPGTPGSAALFVYGFKELGGSGYRTVFDNVAASTGTQPASSAAPTACSRPVDTRIAPQWDRAVLGCPTAPAATTWAAVQAFERGLMLWRADLQLIYTFHDGGRWERWPDLWTEGAALPDRGQPPAGLEAPVRGFGFVWATEDPVFRNLGWARWPESGICGVVQEFEKGLVILRSQTDLCAGQASSKASSWFGSAEAHNDGTWR